VIVIDSSSDSAGSSSGVEEVAADPASSSSSVMLVVEPQVVRDKSKQPLWRKNAATILPAKLNHSVEMFKQVSAGLCEPHQVATNPLIVIGRCLMVTLRGKKQASPVVVRASYFNGKEEQRFYVSLLKESPETGEYVVGATHKLALRPLAIVSDLEFDLPIDAKLRKKHRSSVVSVARKKKAEEDSERRELEGLSSPAKKSRVELSMKNAGAKSNLPDMSQPALKRSERSRAPRVHMYDFFVH